MTSYKINDSLYLVRQQVSQGAPKAVTVEPAVNHIMVVDCSGSMWNDLPKIQVQLKAKLPKILKAEDTISIIWFSGRGQYGALLEGEPVATLADLADVNKAIDRWLRPTGLTGFKEPLEEVSKLAERVAKKNPKGVPSLFFMSDGCDNQWPRADVLKAVEKAGQAVRCATFVEYGYYADRQLITAMAEKCGGNVIFAEDFDKYSPNFEAVMQRKPTGAPKIEVEIKGDVIGGFAYTVANGELVTYAVEGTSVKVPEDTQDLWFVAPKPLGKSEPFDTSVAAPAYAALSLYAQRMKSDVVFAFLKTTGDVRFIEQFANCFGKQKFSEFMESTKAAAFDDKQRLTAGYDPNKVPRDDAFTVLDLLQVLASDEDNRVLLDSKDWKYSAIGRGRIDASEVLTPEEQAEVGKLTAELTLTKDAKKIKDLTAKIAAITENKQALKFVADKNEDGYPISTLTYNQDRPNVSFLVKRTGTIDLSARLPKEHSKVPAQFKTHIHRNYAVIKDGLVNLERLPVRLTAGTIRKLREMGMPMETILGTDGETPEQARTRATKASDGRPVNVVFDVKSLPVINRKMVKEISAKEFFELAYQITKIKAAQKVYNAFQKDIAPKTSKGLTELYGEEATTWLKEQGITDGGFNPKSVQAEATDFYMGKELAVSLKGLSSLPTLKDVQTKIAKGGALTASQALMAPSVKEVTAYLDSKPSKDDSAKWIETKARETTLKTRELMGDIAKLTFTIVVGQTWFKEFKSLDENTMTLTIDGEKVEGKVEQKEIEIKI